jgi:hypothetical protein
LHGVKNRLLAGTVNAVGDFAKGKVDHVASCVRRESGRESQKKSPMLGGLLLRPTGDTGSLCVEYDWNWI